MSILIRDVRYLTKDGVKKGNIYIEENLISEFKANEADVVINGKNKLAIPGLVNLHTHSPMTLFRGYGDDMELHEWLEEKIWPLEKKLTKKLVYLGSKLAIAEMLLNGITTFNDMYFFMDGVAEAVEESGIRGFLGYGMIDLFDKEKREKEIKETRSFVKRAKRYERVVPTMTPHAIYTCSKELLEWTRDFAREKGLLIHIHLSETRKEVYDFLKKGKRPVEYLDSLDFLGDDVIAAHVGWVTMNEMKILSKRGVSVAHCPVSNAKLASGVAPVPEMLKLGINVGLGTDGAASNNSLDLFQEMKFCALIHKVYRWDPTLVNAREVFEMATVKGAKALRLNAGEIAEGKLADIVLLDERSVGFQPLYDPISNLVYSKPRVTDVIVDGRLVVRDGKILTFDVGETLREVEKVTGEMVHR
ncbi:MAG: amidohydrolase [Nanoarchaeota archaeon]|nr:amidohydrolase [Nanoarchaeota archaeon]